MKRLSLLAVFALSACGPDRAAFRPVDNVTRTAPGGNAAASYEIRGGPQQDAHARVNLWTRGAYVENQRTFVRVGMEVRNTGSQLVSVDPNTLQLDPYSNSGRRLPSLELVQAQAPGASVTVPPGEASTISLLFASRGEIDPDHIGNLRLRWAVEHDDGRRYLQFTDFRRVREYVASGYVYYDPVYGYYDPFLYGPPFGYHLRYRVPVQRVIVTPQRPSRTVIRDHRRR